MPDLRCILTLPLAGTLEFMVEGVLSRLRMDFPNTIFMTHANYIIARHNISIEFVRRNDGYVDLLFAYPESNDLLATTVYEHLKNIFQMHVPNLRAPFY
ncbi:unnamed protein product [Rodentolepis nana]|uniref:ACT domain-containing protein n=1 Tax=Rodentolepis nana TaxID=102285 RepID=A0A0R3T2L6_RODNA|nr:unnamed protein product [Rodentolepis nana]